MKCIDLEIRIGNGSATTTWLHTAHERDSQKHHRNSDDDDDDDNGDADGEVGSKCKM